MKRVVVMFLFIFSVSLFSQKYKTVAEKTDYSKTSLYTEIMELLHYSQQMSDSIKLSTLCITQEGRIVPLVIVSKEGITAPSELKATGKSAVLVMANIHAGEIEGKEAVLKLIRDVAEGRESSLFTDQVVLVIPNFNADGNERLSKDNRRDNGPEYAGIRYNSQNLDLNRDYIKAESVEVQSFIKLLKQWDPVLFLDMHTKDGSYHREPVTYTTASNPNGDLNLKDYMWKKLFPEVRKTLKNKYNYDSVPYGNFMDRGKPEKGWINNTVNPRFGTNYVGLRNRFTILDENYPYADFKTRVLSSYGFLRAVLEYTNAHIKELREMVDRADRETSSSFMDSDLVLKHKVEKLFDITLKSYKFKKIKITKKNRHKYPWWYKDYFMEKLPEHRDYKMPYYAGSSPVTKVKLPEAYVIDPGQKVVVDKLKLHGIIVKKIVKPVKMQVQEFMLKSVKPVNRIYQGKVFIKVEGSYEAVTKDIPEGSFVVSLKQPLGRLAAVMLEPESEDSLLSWGFFNRFIVTQWGNKPAIYPVYRTHKLNKKDVFLIH